MRRSLFAAGILAEAIWPDEARLILVNAAAIVLEALPFVVAGILAERVLRRTSLVAYAGCGCVAGPSARSLPAAALTWFAFGPLPALARVAAAAAVDRYLRRNREPGSCAHGTTDLVTELERLLPFAIAAAIGAQIAARAELSHANLSLQIAAGGALGFLASPCAIGSVAVAAALRAQSPAAAAAFLCVAGIVDLHALLPQRMPQRNGGDAFAYAVLAAGAGFVACRHGAELVRPAFAPALAVCAVAAATLAFSRRNQRACMHGAPAVVLLGALIAAPPPVYHATETTLTDVFPGERLSFTGVLTRDGRAAALVRYAITCCRADAAPVVVRLARPANVTPGTWVRADGIMVGTPEGMALSADRIAPVGAPADPFVYR